VLFKHKIIPAEEIVLLEVLGGLFGRVSFLGCRAVYSCYPAAVYDRLCQLSTAQTNFRRHRADRTSNATVKVNIHKRRPDRFLNRPPLHYEPSGTRQSDTVPFIYASGPVLRAPITRYRLS